MLIILLWIINTGTECFINDMHSRPTYLFSPFLDIEIIEEIGVRLKSTETINEL